MSYATVTGGLAATNYHHWSAEDDAVMRDAYRQGNLAQNTAARLGVSVSAVFNRAHKLGLRHKRMARSLKERFYEHISPEPTAVAGYGMDHAINTDTARSASLTSQGKHETAAQPMLRSHSLDNRSRPIALPATAAAILAA
jgi:hypothetical protein